MQHQYGGQATKHAEGRARTGVNTPHHGLKDGPADVGDGDSGGLLLFVVAIKHGAEGVRGGQQRDAVRVEIAPIHHEGHVRQCGVVHILLAKVHLRRRRRGRAVDRRRRICLLRQLKQRACRQRTLISTLNYFSRAPCCHREAQH